VKISILTVVYNNEKTIAEAIESVLNQDYPQLEYLVIDGGSKDDTVAQIKRYESRLAHWRSEPDRGMYDAMNKAIGLATGEVVGILNSDDVYAHPQVLSHVMDIFLQHPEVEIVYGHLDYVQADNLQAMVRRWRSIPYYDTFFEDGQKPAHPTFFVRRHTYSQAGLFRWQDFKISADYELMLRFLKIHRFKSYCLDEVLVLMRTGGASNRGLANVIRASAEDLKAWRVNQLQAPWRFLPSKFWLRAKQLWAARFGSGSVGSA
jgi:glycosyltransferase involved in cell wall biosynthesis